MVIRCNQTRLVFWFSGKTDRFSTGFVNHAWGPTWTVFFFLTLCMDSWGWQRTQHQPISQAVAPDDNYNYQRISYTTGHARLPQSHLVSRHRKCRFLFSSGSTGEWVGKRVYDPFLFKCSVNDTVLCTHFDPFQQSCFWRQERKTTQIRVNWALILLMGL